MIVTPKVMRQAIGYVAERESDIRKYDNYRDIMYHDLSFHLRHDLQRRILMKWANNFSLQTEYDNPFDYLNKIESERFEAADPEKRKRTFRRVDKWCLTISDKYEFFRQFLDEKEDR